MWVCGCVRAVGGAAACVLLRLTPNRTQASRRSHPSTTPMNAPLPPPLSPPSTHAHTPRSLHSPPPPLTHNNSSSSSSSSASRRVTPARRSRSGTRQRSSSARRPGPTSSRRRATRRRTRPCRGAGRRCTLFCCDGGGGGGGGVVVLCWVGLCCVCMCVRAATVDGGQGCSDAVPALNVRAAQRHGGRFCVPRCVVACRTGDCARSLQPASRRPAKARQAWALRQPVTRSRSLC